MSGAKPGQDVDIDLGQLFRALWERRLKLVAVTAGVAVLAFVGTRMVAPEYKGEAQVLIELRTPDFSERTQPANSNADPILDDLGISSQVQVLQSTDLIKQVARDLKLSERQEFDPAANTSFFKRLLISFGVVKNPLDVAPEERVLKTFREKLQVYQVEKSRVIGLNFTSEDPKLAAAIPNKMAQVYLAMQSGAKLDTDSEAARWLEPEIASLREKVREAEKKVSDYRATTDLQRTGQDQTFAGQQLTNVSAELTRVQAELGNANARAESVRQALKSGGPVDTIADVIASPTIQQLKAQEAQIQNQIADLSMSLLDGHPRLKGLRAQLAGIREQINVETRKILKSLENEAEVAKLRQAQLVAQLNKAKTASAKADDQQVGLNALEREAAAQRDLLQTYLARYREASSRAGKNAAPADARVISTAVVPNEVYFPKVGPIVMVAALAAFLLSAVFIMLAELFSGRAWKTVTPETARVAAPVAVAASPERMRPSRLLRAVRTRRESTRTPAAAVGPAVAISSVPEGMSNADPVVEAEEEHEQADVAAPASLPAEDASTNQAVQAPAAEKEVAAAEPEAEVIPPFTTRVMARLDRTPEPSAAEEQAEEVHEEPAAATSSVDAPADGTLDGGDVVAVSPLDDEQDGNDFSVASVARYLAASDKRIVACISPTGDDGSTASVELVRRISGLGFRAIIIDMTGSALPSRLMGDSTNLQGITDILAGKSSIASCIHGDKYSEAHFIPHGTADPARAMRGADRLTMIVGALSEAYEKVLIECGPIDGRSAERLTRNDNAEIVLSMPGASEEKIARILASFEATGRDEVILMSNSPLPPAGNGDSQVA
ncbi:exopolysaccharide transport family protein [Rhizobium sp. C4]|uniref:exopolysaccharide transport family protein n=1 Tax=Rhizobium sp. C4 TaxID=1349800 RepID=UPI001E47486B|nr:exopolysaccharide transport family protein [Rhizobium sp. C4]MCD2171627.1 exopolysaccharide transport family protein [Rhizobium sp. C4]